MKRQLKIKEEESKEKQNRLHVCGNKQTNKICFFLCERGRQSFRRFVCVSDGCDSFPTADI